MEKDFLDKLNSCINQTNYQAIQAQRAPKNSNNDMAVLDGISEAINNHIYRQGSHAMGMSVALSGSGMVFDLELFKNTILNMESIGGFDRELEYRLIEQHTKVKYFREAKVFDEKIDDQQNFSNQRKRWISSQYVYLQKYFLRGTAALLRGDLVYFHSTVWRNIQLPRLVNLGLISIISFFAFLFRAHLHFSYLIWLVLWSLNAISMFIAIPREFYSSKMLKSILLLPRIFYSMLLILFKLKGANDKFIHTQHKSA
jgi:cellulose synthase/poly-beta-1,6-N-acetylglucosamine synthase-like glycosyltransferase